MILGYRNNSTDKEYTVISRGIPTAPSGVTYSDVSDHCLPDSISIITTVSIPCCEYRCKVLIVIEFGTLDAFGNPTSVKGAGAGKILGVG